MARSIPVVPIVALLAMAGCGRAKAPVSTLESATFASALGVDLQSMTKAPSGVYRKDLTVGTGPAVADGKRVSIHYTGWLPNGKQFDVNGPDAEPFQFTIGAGEVVPGFDEAVRGMAVGGERLVVIPPALGYGAAGAGNVIPPNSILVFKVELVAAQ